MGYKGISLMNCGYFYAPYVPLSETPVVSFSELPGTEFVDLSDPTVEYPNRYEYSRQLEEINPPAFDEDEMNWCEEGF
jgi:hypothetical protein